jgi:hypothetical protein
MKIQETTTEIRLAHVLRDRILPGNWVPPNEPPLEVTVSQRNNYGPPNEVILAPDKVSFQPTKGKVNIFPTTENFQHKDPKKYKDTILGPYKKLKKEIKDPNAPQLKKLEKKIENADKEYRTLKLAFNFVANEIRKRCTEINNSIKNPKDALENYKSAKKNYVDLIHNLNLHDPEKIDLQNGLGFGRVLGWTIADVVVNYDRKHDLNLITGVTVVSEWTKGYHTSSSGIPIPD